MKKLSYWERSHGQIVSEDGPCLAKIDPARNRFPFAIVWTPIHPITWILPFVGHMGICDSRGICLDFTGAIGVDDLAFGSPTRYITLDTSKIHADLSQICENDQIDREMDDDLDTNLWDAAVMKASSMFENRLHLMICGNDCHSHVAVALNLMSYGGFTCWNKVILASWMFFCGKHVSTIALVQTWAGPCIVIILFSVLHFGA